MALLVRGLLKKKQKTKHIRSHSVGRLCHVREEKFNFITITGHVERG